MPITIPLIAADGSRSTVQVHDPVVVVPHLSWLGVPKIVKASGPMRFVQGDSTGTWKMDCRV
jgi:hypothetical protein